MHSLTGKGYSHFLNDNWDENLKAFGRDYHYLLMEPCMGGELMTLLQTKKHLPESWTRFYGACTIKAIQFLHERKIGKVN